MINRVLRVFPEPAIHRSGNSPNLLRAGIHRIPFRYGLSPNVSKVYVLKIVSDHDLDPNGDFPVLYCLCNRPSVSRIGSGHIAKYISKI